MPFTTDSNLNHPYFWAGQRWKDAFGVERHQEKRSSAELKRQSVNYSSELQDLIAFVRRAGRRVLANVFLNEWLVWVSWISLGLILGAAVSNRLVGLIVAAVVLLAVGAIVVFGRVWSRRSNEYGVACQLDEALGLQDRLSTAIHLGATGASDEMVLYQRRDALKRLHEVDSKRFCPVRLPSFAAQSLTVALLALALLSYRIHFKAPILALVQSAANSNVEKSVISPLVGVVKKDLLALVNREPEVQQAAADAETVPGLPDAKNGDDPSQANKNSMTPDGDWDEDSQAANNGEPTDMGDPQAGDAGAQGQGQDASQAADAPQNQQSADANQPGANQNGSEKGSGDQQQANQQSSAFNSVLQALKNMAKNMSGQPSTSPGESGGQPSAAGSSQQAGNSPGQGAKSDNSKDSDQNDAGNSPGSKKPGGGAGNGSTPVAKQNPKNTPLPGNTVSDRVDLEANNFRQQGRIRTTSAVGMAQLPLRDIKPQPEAAVKGAEQENIPVRYRLYVQRYFEHTDAKTDTKTPE